jgi:hypothetical protein
MPMSPSFGVAPPHMKTELTMRQGVLVDKEGRALSMTVPALFQQIGC